MKSLSIVVTNTTGAPVPALFLNVGYVPAGTVVNANAGPFGAPLVFPPVAAVPDYPVTVYGIDVNGNLWLQITKGGANFLPGEQTQLGCTINYIIIN